MLHRILQKHAYESSIHPGATMEFSAIDVGYAYFEYNLFNARNSLSLPSSFAASDTRVKSSSNPVIPKALWANHMGSWCFWRSGNLARPDLLAIVWTAFAKPKKFLVASSPNCLA